MRKSKKGTGIREQGTEDGTGRAIMLSGTEAFRV
jgi:hypothetical protein